MPCSTVLSLHDFYPRPPRGGRPISVVTVLNTSGISIHALREEGDPCRGSLGFCMQNFYPRPPRGGRPAPGGVGMSFSRISIHALREEGDIGRIDDCDKRSLFLSTPSARRATNSTTRFSSAN